MLPKTTNIEDADSQQVLDMRLRLLDDFTKAVVHVAEAVRLALVDHHLDQEYIEQVVNQNVWVEGHDLARLTQEGAEGLHDECFIVHTEHLDQVADHIVIVQLDLEII